MMPRVLSVAGRDRTKLGKIIKVVELLGDGHEFKGRKDSAMKIRWYVPNQPDGASHIVHAGCDCHMFVAMVGRRRNNYFAGIAMVERPAQGAVNFGASEIGNYEATPEFQEFDEETAYPTEAAAIDGAKGMAVGAMNRVEQEMMREGRHHSKH